MQHNLLRTLWLSVFALFFSASAHSAIPALLTPSDTIVGGVKDGSNFLVGSPSEGSTRNQWPGAEAPEQLIDGKGQKYLNFVGKTQPSGAIITPNNTGSKVIRMTLWTANDEERRDPASYEIYGTRQPITISEAGDTMPLSSFTLISSGSLSLPSSRNLGGDNPLLDDNSQTISFDNSTAYRSYLILFPTIKNSGTANSMQIAELQLYGFPSPVSEEQPQAPSQVPTLSVWGLGLLSLSLAFLSRRKVKV